MSGGGDPAEAVDTGGVDLEVVFGIADFLRELGPDGLARFLRLNRSDKGDYTLDRIQWQKDLTVDQIVASLKR